ncbi:GntR family transcriptional regulator [Kibdelosporangium philippinense]|uniref:GntR family transcriptional regulator n=1 Tax=Kibdelosporangium philippinense TaxID=211113 RepID=A0ABS8ZAK0_9PSEU|nr:GntR family transcriptional regulator [Kibdelosporangium philippinense]MCE7004896.1 GntR family transcriptional regulator [Kibdelosporangium philippinense]
MPRNKHQPDPSVPLPEHLSRTAPKGDELRGILERLVAAMQPGDMLPSERVLAERFGIARMTVRQELHRLSADGLVVRRPRGGTYVAEPPVSHVDFLTSYSDFVRSKGLTPGAKVLSAGVEPVSARLADRLELNPGDPIFRLVRLRTADDIPMAIERTNLSVDRFPGIEQIDWNDRSLHEALRDRWGSQPRTSKAHIWAVLPDLEDAKLLQIDAGQPCFSIEATPRDADGRVIEAGRSVYRGDRYDVVVAFVAAP